MSTVTTRLGLVKPTTLEQYALSVLNNNADLIDTAMPRITTQAGTTDDANRSNLNAYFTRIEFGNGNGIIIANLFITLKTALVLNANTGANVVAMVAAVPAGYRPPETVQNDLGLLSGVSRGDIVNIAIGPTGDLTMRSGAAGFTTTAGVSLVKQHTWKWSGAF